MTTISLTRVFQTQDTFKEKCMIHCIFIQYITYKRDYLILQQPVQLLYVTLHVEPKAHNGTHMQYQLFLSFYILPTKFLTYIIYAYAKIQTSMYTTYPSNF